MGEASIDQEYPESLPKIVSGQVEYCLHKNWCGTSMMNTYMYMYFLLVVIG